jgi:hypothetical protein
MEELIILILKHDLHKLSIPGGLPHSKALVDEVARRADGVASRLSRNGDVQEFEKFYLRKSYLTHLNINEDRRKEQVSDLKGEVAKLFKEKDPYKLHDLILNSTILNLFSEARQHPFTSYKYHLLLACSLYNNLKNTMEWHELYLSENSEVESPFQVIYRDGEREWALLPSGGMSRVSLKFCTAWVRRTELSLGGDSRVLDGLLSQIGSWSAALATVEDWMKSEKV